MERQRPRRRTSLIVAGFLVATAALVMAACGSSVGSTTTTTMVTGHPGGTTAPTRTRTDANGSACSPTTDAPSIALTDMSPTPTITVPVGSRLVVLIPPWSDAEDTPLHRGDPTVVAEVCSVTLPDHGTRTILAATAPGRSVLSATVTPGSDTMTPEWLGTVVVTGGS